MPKSLKLLTVAVLAILGRPAVGQEQKPQQQVRNAAGAN